jgi:O-antigen/teichoic acid export membrane protein
MKLNNQTINSKVKGAVWFTISTFFQNAISLIATPIFSRIFTLEEAGTYSLYLTWYGIFSVVATLNVSGTAFNAMMHDCKSDQEEKDFLYNSYLLSAFFAIVTLLIYGTFSFFGYNFSGLSFALFLLIAMSIFVDIPIKLYIAYSKYKNSYLKCCLLMMSQSVLSFSFALGAVFLFSDRVFGRILGKECGFFLLFVVAFIFLIKRKSFRVNWHQIWHIFLIVSPLVFHYLAADALSQADRIILNQDMGASTVGVYSLVYSVVALLTSFISAFDSVFSPWVLKKIDAKEKKKVFSVLLPFYLFMFFVISCVSFVSREVVYLFGGSKYLEGVRILPILMVSVYCVMFYSFVSEIEFYYEKTWAASLFTVIAAVVNVFLDLWLIPTYSMLGAALGTIVSYGIMAVFHYLFSEYLCRKKLLVVNFFHCGALALISVLGILVLLFSYYFYDNTIVRWVCFSVFMLGALILVIIKRKSIVAFISVRKSGSVSSGVTPDGNKEE